MNKVITNINLWDLDGTVINSFHRVAPCFDNAGNLDLNKYAREACKHELIMQDSLLPLVELMRSHMNQPNTINYIVTARLMSKSDYYFLRKQGLRGRGEDNIKVLSRDTLHKYMNDPDAVKEIYHSRDAEYKAFYFDQIISRHGRDGITYTMYDDHKGVLDMARRYGFNAVDATALNDMLTLGIKLASESFLDEIISDDMDIEYLADRLKFTWDTMTSEEQESFSVKYPKLALAI